MISAFELEPITVREQRADLPQAEPAQLPRPVNGFYRNHVAVSGPQLIIARERDHWDMARLVSGDEQALDSLVQRHSKRLFAHLERIVKICADATELVQEAFIPVFHHRLNYNFQFRFTTCLYVIGSHLAINLPRWRSRRLEFVRDAPLSWAQTSARGVGKHFESEAMSRRECDPPPKQRDEAKRIPLCREG